jgi:hypothetical protein
LRTKLLQRLKHDLKSGLATFRLGTAQAANPHSAELLRLRLEPGGSISN